MNADTIKQHDEVLGYTLTRKIGSGGYGDVWEADAPGGLKKALKIIHGFHGEKRAQAELKALDRIKEARHPFLLSLERIEISNSKLIIITELADQSLADLAQEYTSRGELGIPRDELLRYMRDSADALDYLNSTFGLQHLDIKPENILLVSGHAKVADFGLVKDLNDATQSLMSGMTPAYAAPELFDGKPGPASDQYSLATVYQEMLTMVRPFPGATPTQLAAQHMHGKPDLRSLPISDQPVIAKALSKDPGDRYKTCVQFVEQLSNRKTRKRVIKSRANVRENVDTESATIVFEGTETSSRTAALSSGQLPFDSIDLELSDPPECEVADSQFQPTLVIGIGNSSSQVLQKIKSRMVARHGDADALPSLRLLCIDSDRDALARLSTGRDPSSIKVNETLATPLRRSDQYRQRKNLDLSWISRRWIYNVPRSLQTEGLRTLGRLVFVDYFETICEKISSCIKDVMRMENVADTCETLGMNPPVEIQPRIILVSNIAGGLGSGMTNDLAYVIRLMIAEQGIKHSKIVGMLMFGNESLGRESGLASANAYAYLSELRHIADGGYPGDSRIGIPEFEDELPFDHAYALRLQSEKENPSISDLDKIAEYICLSSTTNCGVFFDTNRNIESEHEEFCFRSFGVSVCGPGLKIQGRDAVEKLSKNLIEKWVSEDRKDGFSEQEFVLSCVNDFDLNLDNTTKQSIALVSELDEYKAAEAQLNQAETVLLQKDAALSFAEIDQLFDRVLDAPKWRKESLGESTELCLAVENEINVEAHRTGDELSIRIMNLLNSKTVSFPRAENVLEKCWTAVIGEHESVIHGLHSYGTLMQQMKQQFDEYIAQGRGRKQFSFERNFIQKYRKIRFQEFALRCCSDHYRVIKSCLNSTKEMIKKFRLQLDVVGKAFNVEEEPKRSSKFQPTVQQMLIDSVDETREQLIVQLEGLVLDAIAEDDGQFLDVLSDSLNWQQQLPNKIIDAAQSVLSNAFKKLSIDDVLSKKNVQPDVLKSWLNGQIKDATPFVTDCGGNASLLLGHPLHASTSIVPKLLSDCFDLNAKTIGGTTGDLVFCFEAEKILLANLAFSILKDAPEAVEIAKRIHSRTDVDWTSLDDLV